MTAELPFKIHKSMLNTGKRCWRRFEYACRVGAFRLHVLDWTFNSHGARSMRLWVRECDGGRGEGAPLQPRGGRGEV